MPIRDHASVVSARQRPWLGSGRASTGSRHASAHPRALVAHEYGRRDYYLRRLLAVSDVLCLALAMIFALALTTETPAHPFSEHLVFGLLTLPAWVVLF